MTTNQTCLAEFAATATARLHAIDRIERILEPAARAIDASRTPRMPYWIDESHDIPTLGIKMIVRAHGKDGLVCAPFDSGTTKWSTQIVGVDSATPETLAEVARVATIWAADVERTYRAKIDAEVARLRAEAQAFAAVASDIVMMTPESK